MPCHRVVAGFLKREALESSVKLVEASCIVFEVQLSQNSALGVDGPSNTEGLGDIYADVDVDGRTPFQLSRCCNRNRSHSLV